MTESNPPPRVLAELDEVRQRASVVVFNGKGEGKLYEPNEVKNVEVSLQVYGKTHVIIKLNLYETFNGHEPLSPCSNSSSSSSEPCEQEKVLMNTLTWSVHVGGLVDVEGAVSTVLEDHVRVQLPLRTVLFFF